MSFAAVHFEYMRVMPYVSGSYVHVMKRGARGLAIVTSNHDRNRFRRLLYHMNDEYSDDAWELDTSRLGPFVRPAHWPPRVPLVDIVSYTLLTNHFHLLVRTRDSTSLGQFIRRVTGSMSKYYNAAHQATGSLFQGSYKGVTISDDTQLQYTRAYIEVKNLFEMHSAGASAAVKKFDQSWDWACSYSWSSLGGRMLGTDMPELCSLPTELARLNVQYKRFAREVMLGKYLPDHVATKDI